MMKKDFFSDIDECDVNNVECAPNAACMNTEGSFMCVCDPGFTGNGSAMCTGKR